MAFWKPTKAKKVEPKPPDTGQAVRAKKKGRRSTPISFEAKMLAIEAISSGADRQDVCEVLGVKPTTISNFLKLYREVGIGGQTDHHKSTKKPMTTAGHHLNNRIEKSPMAGEGHGGSF